MSRYTILVELTVEAEHEHAATVTALDWLRQPAEPAGARVVELKVSHPQKEEAG
jgi:hypothetical protein